MLGNLPPGRVEVIHNGVAFAAELDGLRSRARDQRRAEGSFTFLLIGRIRPQKGQESAIRAFSQVAGRFPGARLEIVGSGEVVDLQRCPGAGRRSRAGRAGRAPGLRRGSLALLPARRRGLDVLRLGSDGPGDRRSDGRFRPVIGHDRGGTSELIRHEQTGLLYAGGDEALADCMRRFLEAPAWVRQLGEQAWQDARERFTIELYASRVASVLRAAATASSAEPSGRIADNR